MYLCCFFATPTVNADIWIGFPENSRKVQNIKYKYKDPHNLQDPGKFWKYDADKTPPFAILIAPNYFIVQNKLPYPYYYYYIIDKL